MEILFATNDKFHSKVHRWLADEPFTHMAVLFFEYDLRLIVEMTKPVGRIVHASSWQGKYEICDEIKIPINDSDEINAFVFTAIYAGMEYDWNAYWWLAFQLLKRKLTGSQIRPENPAKNHGSLICTDIMHLIFNYLPIDMARRLKGVDFSAVTPYMVYKKIKGYKN